MVMLRKTFVLSSVIAAALAQGDDTLPDLITLINQTHGFSYLNTYINTYPGVKDSVAGLTNITVLAPSDTAIYEFFEDPRFESLEAGGEAYFQTLISYHILEGVHDNITDWLQYSTHLTSPEYTNVTGGQVVFGYYDDHGFQLGFYSGADIYANAPPLPIPFNGGIVYPINNILNIPASLTKEVSGDYNGTSFIEALNRTGLRDEVELLKDTTFFVPNNAAFESVEQSLSELSTEDLAKVLQYHVVPGIIAYYNTLVNGTTLTTLQGQELTVFINEEEEMFINGAGVSSVDIPVANGVVVIIDNVLNPQASVQPPANDAEEGVPAFPTGGSGTSEGSASTTTTTTAAAAAATFTGAAAPLKAGAASLISLVAAAAIAIVL
ncbi:uncharacterized protein A1O9_09854 [Exophiala aquamarina CBS 119918]|uniref:FAS1 domain-containing protein n=1 Tax=Exophiala aquamarina CBS 119918 TaxID=1182545 RepID=A0A072P1R1_9EURO|nr:uncharacterized protein A1O9_09854 [Exophiala aquamarina CBS 119918]KEF54059.1 hypothetical protein A1O9_09854 [Exophiala aquamarina CBS 119918]